MADRYLYLPVFRKNKDLNVYMHECSIVKRTVVLEHSQSLRNIYKVANFRRFLNIGGIGMIVEIYETIYTVVSTIGGNCSSVDGWMNLS